MLWMGVVGRGHAAKGRAEFHQHAALVREGPRVLLGRMLKQGASVIAAWC